MNVIVYFLGKSDVIFPNFSKKIDISCKFHLRRQFSRDVKVYFLHVLREIHKNVINFSSAQRIVKAKTL